MAAEPAADSIVALADPDRAIVELVARRGPLCVQCLAATLAADRLTVSDRVQTLTEQGYLRHAARDRYDVTPGARAALRDAPTHGAD